jgi:hypothetical protein
MAIDEEFDSFCEWQNKEFDKEIKKECVEMAYEVKVSVSGVEVALKGVPTKEEEKQLEDLLVPGGFIETSLLKKVKLISEQRDRVLATTTEAKEVAPAPQPVAVAQKTYAPPQAKTPSKPCPICGTRMYEKTVKKEGPNTGKKFYTCKNECVGKDGRKVFEWV